MKIALVGTHGVGKTTLVNTLAELFNFQDYKFDINVTRWVRDLGFPINESTSDVSQEINMIKRVAHLNSYPKIIADRSLIDIYAYSLYAFRNGGLSEQSINYQGDLFRTNISKYDVLFMLKPEFEMERDGTRSEDIEYQSAIHNLIYEIIRTEGVRNIIKVTGTVQERVEQVIDGYNLVKFLKGK